LSARDKYLQHYAEPEASALLQADLTQCWRNVLVIPAYRESPELLKDLPDAPDTLLILVLNRPDSDPDTRCNDALRDHLMALPRVKSLVGAGAMLLAMADGRHLLLMERPEPLPQNEAVGLARKIGCDAALALGVAGYIGSRWIHCSDADAKLPEEYFRAAEQIRSASALSYPYHHTRPADPREQVAIDLYEQYLRQYVDGLRDAGSPYAFHTLGSCLAVDATAYARVRGFPRRAGGEDFYLLNKLAKQGPVAIPDCAAIRLSARLSQRAPFGTGPALVKLLKEEHPQQCAMFYDPRCFEGLAALLACMAEHGRPGLEMDDLQRLLAPMPQVRAAAEDLGIAKFLTHASSQCSSREAFERQFQQWFDGFRTLKFIHALCASWERISLQELERQAALSRAVPPHDTLYT
jgi:hypothetical protein